MKPRLLDLFAGAGGAAMGYARAGFSVVGVDIKPQPNYPFEFVQLDALAALRDMNVFYEFAAIHASPPCQAHTSMQSVARNADAHPDLVGPTRDLLEATGLPYVIENVVGAPLRDPFVLCGSMFVGHKVQVGYYTRELHRHRLFETNWDVGLVPQCLHRWKAAGVYGDHFRMGRRSSDGEYSGARALELGREVMGIDWMTWPELVQAIPPSYTEFVGAQLLAHIQAGAEAPVPRREETERSAAQT